MRKWMRERLQRRKKTPAEASDQPTPPPLQPAYFDAEQQPSAAPDASNIESEISPPLPSEPKPVRRARASSPEAPPEAQPSEEQPAEAQSAISQANPSP